MSKKIVLKWIIALTVFVLGLSFFTAKNIVAMANTQYVFANGEISGLVSIPTEDISLSIPASINGMPVTSIVSNNVEGFAFNNAACKDYIVGLDFSNADNLTTIAKGTFNGCDRISGVINLNESITLIDRSAFSGVVNIDKVIVPHTTTSLNVHSGAFEAGTKFVFSSADIMNEYLTQYNATWSKHVLTYMYDLQIKIGDADPITVAKVEHGVKLGDMYNEILANHFAGYDNVVLLQDGIAVDSNTILNGSIITIEALSAPETEVQKHTENLSFDYGTECIITPNKAGSYQWTHKGEVVSAESELELTLNAGTYTYICTITNDDIIEEITYVITINPITYPGFAWPSLARYEYYDVSAFTFLNMSQRQDLDIEFYKLVDDEFVVADGFSIGRFKAKVTPKSDNYLVAVDTFEFDIDYTYLDIVWDTPIFNYIGEIIVPKHYLIGNTRSHDVTLLKTGDINAIDVGNYTITATGLSMEYYKISETSEKVFNWQIIKTTLEVQWGTTIFNYNSAITPTATGVFEDIVIELEVNGINSNDFTNAGEYSVTVSVPSRYTGFELSGDTQTTLVVNPIIINVSFFCSNEYTYCGEEIEVVGTITTENVPESVELVITGNKYKDAGEYSAVVSGTNNPNYSLSAPVNFDWKINPKSLVVAWRTAGIIYNGTVRKPGARVETGIDGENIELIVETDENILANQGATTGYMAVAKLPEGVTNYTLIGTQKEYFIMKANPSITPHINHQMMYEYVYDGNNHLPTCDYIGEEGNLQILIDGVETTTGVKEIGTYEVEFRSPASANYHELLGTHIYLLIIKPYKVTASIQNIGITLQNSQEGFNGSFLNVVEIDDYSEDLLATVDNVENYTVTSVLDIASNENLPLDNTIQLSFERVDVNRLKVYVVEYDRLVEKTLTINNNTISFVGTGGVYYILSEKPAWIESNVGIIVIVSVFAVAVVGLGLLLIIKNKRPSLNKQIATLVEARLQEKIANGEQITTEETLKIREQIINELKEKQNNKK